MVSSNVSSDKGRMANFRIALPFRSSNPWLEVITSSTAVAISAFYPQLVYLPIVVEIGKNNNESLCVQRSPLRV